MSTHAGLLFLMLFAFNLLNEARGLNEVTAELGEDPTPTPTPGPSPTPNPSPAPIPTPAPADDTTAATFDFTQCVSEGGSKQCAKCDTDGGVLPCSKIKTGQQSDKCKDSGLLKTKKFWRATKVIGEDRLTGACTNLKDEMGLKGFAYVHMGDQFGLGSTAQVVTKARVSHPNGAPETIGIVMFKRLVLHFKKDGTEVGDVFKQGFCIKCDTQIFPHKMAVHTEDTHRAKFVDDCIPKAVDENGEVKKESQCGESEMQLAKAEIAAF